MKRFWILISFFLLHVTNAHALQMGGGGGGANIANGFSVNQPVPSLVSSTNFTPLETCTGSMTATVTMPIGATAYAFISSVGNTSDPRYNANAVSDTSVAWSWLDPTGNSYQDNVGAQDTLYVYKVANHGGGTFTVTATISTAGAGGCESQGVVLVFNNMPSATIFDVGAAPSNPSGQTTYTAGPTPTTQNVTEICLAAVGIFGHNALPATGPTNNFIGTGTPLGSLSTLYTAYFIQGTGNGATTYSTSWTGTAAGYSGVLVCDAEVSNVAATVNKYGLSGVVNNVVPLTNFGASGSIKTATCTANGTATLTGCSGGDFLAGQTVRVLQAGVNPTIAAPATPTVTAHVLNGASSTSQSFTGSCTINTNILTLTTPANVEVGQAISITGAGSTTVAQKAIQTTRVILTANCTATVSGVAVTLTTLTYAYRIAAVEGWPNGPMTAASTEAAGDRVTQTAQSPQPASDPSWVAAQSFPSVFTTINWTAVAGASFYVIYRSINGATGPFNFWTEVSSSLSATCTPTTYATAFPCFDDFGQGDNGWTCTDLGVPCTAPNSATPNDIYAQIATINGTTWTLKSDPLPPKYKVAPGSGQPYPSIPVQSGTVTVYHDDTPAFQSFYSYLLSNPILGQTTLFIPPGDYNVAIADPYGGRRAFSLMGVQNVTVQGAGWSSKIHAIGDRNFGLGRFIFAICQDAAEVAPVMSNLASCTSASYIDENNIVDPAQPGSDHVTTITASAAGAYFPGEWVEISDTHADSDRWAEMNQVKSVDSTSGLVNLQWPLTKQYSNALTAPWNERVSGQGVPTITGFKNGIAADNIVIRDLWYEGVPAFYTFGFAGRILLDHNYVHTAQATGGNGHDAFFKTTNSTILEDSTFVSNLGGVIGGDAGARDIASINNEYTGHGAIGGQNCVESSANCLIQGNTIRYLGPNGPNMTITDGLLSFGPCIECRVLGNNFIVGPEALYAGIYITSAPTMMTISGNRFYIPQLTKSSYGVYHPILLSGDSDTNYMQVVQNNWFITTDTSASDGYATYYDLEPATSNNSFDFNFSGTLTASAVRVFNLRSGMLFGAIIGDFQSSCGTNPGAGENFVLACSGTTMATLVLSSSCGVSFSGSPSIYNCAAGSKLTLTAPASSPSGADIDITMAKNR